MTQTINKELIQNEYDLLSILRSLGGGHPTCPVEGQSTRQDEVHTFVFL